MKTITVRGVYRTFDVDAAPVRALRDAHFEVDEGEFTVLMGPSGCGKSTLVNVIAGLERPDEGEVWLAGQGLHAASDDERAQIRRRHVGMVFQFFNLLDGMSALENVGPLAPAPTLAGTPPA